MTSGMIGAIVVLVLALTVMGTGYYAYRRIRNKIRNFSSMAFGTTDILQGLQSVERESEITPKSVSAATSLYLPSIMREFPDFHYDEMKRRAENVLTSWLRSLQELDASLLTEGTSELHDKLRLNIDTLRDAGTRVHYRNPKIHRTEISSYRKAKGRCCIVFQTAVQYNFWSEKGGQIAEGDKEKLRQSKYDVELIYIQDRDLVENTADSGLAMNCPNCGAPLPKLGAKICAYCDSPIVEFNIRTWNFSDVQEKT